MHTGVGDSPKFLSLEEAADLVEDGALLAFGGGMVMEPMALVRALVRKGKKRLKLLTVPSGGFGADLLMGAGCIESIETAQVVLGEFGQAPNFRTMVQEGRVRVFDQT